MPSPPSPPAALPEELVEDILLRFPPSEPASLFRAALVCKPWCRLISSTSFRRRFRERHRTPPMLGFLCNTGYKSARFVPTATFCAPGGYRFGWDALDARHGRVLVRRFVVPEDEDEGEHEDDDEEDALIVWDPITDEQRELPPTPLLLTINWAAALLCAGAGTSVCDHLDCHRGPFLVVFVGFDPDELFICTYSSDVDEWSEPMPISTWRLDDCLVQSQECTVLVGNALYFGIKFRSLTLKYNLESREMSWIQLPWECSYWRRHVLTATDEGVLGFVTVFDSILSMWLKEDAHEVDAGWTIIRVIDIKTLLPLDGVLLPTDVVGFADGPCILFTIVGSVLYTLDLKTYKVKLYQDTGIGCVVLGTRIGRVVPYMSFYTPELEGACTGEEPTAGGSSA